MFSDKDKTYTDHPDYVNLPEPIKAMYTPKQFAWMPEDEKRNIVETECMPEVEED